MERAPLATTFVNDNTLTAQVEAAQLANPGDAAINVRAAISSPFASNVLLQVEAMPLPVDSLAPGSATAGNAGDTDGQRRAAADSQVLWDGAPVLTTFVNSSKLTAQIDAWQLARRRSRRVRAQSDAAPAGLQRSRLSSNRRALSPQVFLPLVMQ
ncbi:MAG: hypothetical protein R2854_03600 [Caldilineaceae bacterium]